MLSVCTTDLYGDLLRHQDVIDRNIQDDAECQHVVDAGKGVRRTAYRTKNTASSGQESGIILQYGKYGCGYESIWNPCIDGMICFSDTGMTN